MNLKEIEKLQNEQKKTDCQKLKALEMENIMLKAQLHALKEELKVEENKSLALFNELSESRAILNMAHSALSKFKKVLILLMLSLIVLTTLFLINHM